mgnify:FL=1
MFNIGRRLSSAEVSTFNQLQLSSLLFTSTALTLTNMGLTDNFLVQFCGYIEYLITGDEPTLRCLYLNSRVEI